MSSKKTQATTTAEFRAIPYCDQIIIAILLVIIIAVPLYFDVHIHSVFDLSKITILYVLTLAILAIWSIRTIITCEQETKGRETIDERRVYHPSSIVPHPSSIVSRLLSQPLSLPIVAFLFVSGLSTIFSINPYLSLVGTYKRYGGFISTIVYVSLFFVIVNFIDKRRLSSLLNVIILTAGAASIYGILQHFGLDLYHWSTSFGYGIRVAATFGHPAFFSAFLIMVIPLVLIKIFSCKERFKAYLYIGILALLLIAFYYTKTRASFLGLIISNLFFFSFIGGKNLLANKTKTVVTITILIGISVFFNVNDKTSVVGRFIGDIKPVHLDNKSGKETDKLPQPALDSDWHVDVARQIEGTTLTRFLQYLTSLRIIYDYPILGIGPDTLGMIYPQYIAKLHREMNEHRGFENQNRIHCDLINITVSTGLLGLGVYVWLAFAYARMVWGKCKKAGRSDKILIIGLCAGCLAYFVQNQFSFGHIPIITLFWFLIAMSVIACPIGYQLSQGPLSRVLAGACLPVRQAGPPSGEAQNPETHKSNLTGWTCPNMYRRICSFTPGKFAKYIFCGITICLIILLITLSLFRYKADIYFEHGRRSLNKNEITEAIHSYEMAVKYNPLSLNYNNVLNGIYLKMAAIGISKESERGTESVPDIFSREQTTMWFANAIEGAKIVQGLYPGDYHSAFTLGQAYHLLDKISDEDMSKNAIKYYKMAITSHPYKFKYRNKLARLYAEKGRYEEAIHELKEGKSIAPSNQAPYLNLAKVFMNDRERYEEAEDILLEFIKRNPDSKISDIYRLLGYIYLKTERWNEVLIQSERIIQLDQGDLEAHKYAIMANTRLERFEDARNLCNRIQDLTGSQNNTYNKYAKEMLEVLSGK
ncbi:MAG: O-antigen ligase family protein [Candidatus Scalindua sp.]